MPRHTLAGIASGLTDSDGAILVRSRMRHSVTADSYEGGAGNQQVVITAESEVKATAQSQG